MATESRTVRFAEQQWPRLILGLLLLGHFRVAISLVSQCRYSSLGPIDPKIALQEQIRPFASHLEPASLVHYWIGNREQDHEGKDLFVQFCLAPSVVTIVKGELPRLSAGQMMLTKETAPQGFEVIDRSGDFLLLRKSSFD